MKYKKPVSAVGRIIAFVVGIGVLGWCCAGICRGQAAPAVLSDAQQNWLAAKGEIRIGTMDAWPPMNFVDRNGRASGIGADYIRAMNDVLDGRLTIVPGPFKTNMEKVKTGELDALMDISPTEERKAFFHFTRVYLDIPHVIVAPKSGPYYGSETDLEGKTVALEKGFYNITYFQKNFPTVRISTYPNTALALDAVARGEASAYAGNRAVAAHIMEKELMAGLKFHGRLNKRGSVLSIGVGKNMPELTPILNKALAAIPEAGVNAIHRKWAGLAAPGKSPPRPELSVEERAWIRQHPKIRANGSPLPPFIIKDANSRMTGISVDILNKACALAGITVEYAGTTWPQTMEMFSAGELDLLHCVSQTKERQSFIRFTDAYLAISTAVYVQKDNHTIRSIRDLEGRTVAVLRRSHFHEALKDRYPKIKIKPSESCLAGLKMVSTGNVDAFLGNQVTARFEIETHLIQNLRPAAYWDELRDDLRIGVHRDAGLFAGIMQKALDAIPLAEKQRIISRYVSPASRTKTARPPGTRDTPRTLVAYIVIVMGSIALALVLLMRAIRRDRVAMGFGSAWFKIAVVAGLTVFVVVVSGLGWLLMDRMKQAVRKDVAAHLKLVLSLIQDRADMWKQERTALMRRLGKDTKLSEITGRLLAVAPRQETLTASKALADARHFFKNSRDAFQSIGFFIINKDGITIGAVDNTGLGAINPIARRHPALLDKAFHGEAGFIPPVTAGARPAGGEDPDKTAAAIYFISPVRDARGTIAAVMTLRIDPVRDLAKLIRSPGRWQTDDLYAFDRNGRMVTPSRFEARLPDLGLLKPGQTAAMTLTLQDPGGDLTQGFRPDPNAENRPLTRMAEQALTLRRQMADLGISQGASAMGSDTQGYRDYRGVKVFGAWLWNRDLDMGLAAEIDAAEAMAGFNRIRLTVFAILGGTLVLSIISVLLVLILGERARKTLETARDDLEEKVAERTLELEENQQRFAALLEAAPDAMVVSDQSGTIVLVNSRTEELFGYPRSELLDACIDMLVPDDIRGDHPQKRALFYNSEKVRQKGAQGLELTGRTKQGNLIPVEIGLSPLQSRSGLLVVASVRDITERKLAEEALRASEESFRLILESVGDGIFGVDTDGCLIFINPSARRLLGYEADDLIGRPIHDTIHHSHADGSAYPVSHCPMFRSYTGGAREQISDENLWRKDGTGFPVEYSTVPVIKNEKITGAVITFRDITERKKMEHALDTERKRLQGILDISPVGVAISTHGTVRFANPQFLGMFDVEEQKAAPDLYVDPEDRERITAALAAGQRIENREIKMYGKNRQVREMLITCMPVDFQGEAGILGWFLDITDRKRAEQEIRKRFDELNRFRRLAVGRENKMIRLKEEINELAGRLGESARYKIVGKDNDREKNV